MNKKFMLENDFGQRFDFSNFENSLSYALEGFGLKYDATYSKVGEYFLANKKELAQKTVTFSCLFKSSSKYRDFVFFVECSEKLKLVYIEEDREFFLDIHVSRVTKKNENRHDFIIANIEFFNTSLFYDRKESGYILDYGANKNRFDFQWDMPFKDELNGVIELNVQGTTPSAYRLEIMGESLKPSIEIIDRNNNAYTVEFDIEIAIGEKLVYSTVDNDLKVILVRADGTQENVFSCLDFKKENFKKLQLGYNKIVATNITYAKLVVFDSYTSI